jgi:transposase
LDDRVDNVSWSDLGGQFQVAARGAFSRPRPAHLGHIATRQPVDAIAFSPVLSDPVAQRPLVEADVTSDLRDRFPGSPERKGDASLTQIAKAFDISESRRRWWVKVPMSRTVSVPGVTSAESAEVRVLKQGNRVLEQENEILRRAAAVFARGAVPNDVPAGP